MVTEAGTRWCLYKPRRQGGQQMLEARGGAQQSRRLHLLGEDELGPPSLWLSWRPPWEAGACARV